jgi:hypothetical protein
MAAPPATRMATFKRTFDSCNARGMSSNQATAFNVSVPFNGHARPK